MSRDGMGHDDCVDLNCMASGRTNHVAPKAYILWWSICKNMTCNTGQSLHYTVMHDTSSTSRSSPSRSWVPPCDAAVVVRSTTTTRGGLTTQASTGAPRCLNSDTPTPDEARGRSLLWLSLFSPLNCMASGKTNHVAPKAYILWWSICKT